MSNVALPLPCCGPAEDVGVALQYRTQGLLALHMAARPPRIESHYCLSSWFLFTSLELEERIKWGPGLGCRVPTTSSFRSDSDAMIVTESSDVQPWQQESRQTTRTTSRHISGSPEPGHHLTIAAFATRAKYRRCETSRSSPPGCREVSVIHSGCALACGQT